MHVSAVSLRLSLALALSMGISASSFGMVFEEPETSRPSTRKATPLPKTHEYFSNIQKWVAAPDVPTALHAKAYATLVQFQSKTPSFRLSKSCFELAVMAEQAGVTLEDPTTLYFYTNVVEKNGFSLKNPMTATHFKAAAQLKKISDKTYSGLIIPKSYFELAVMAEQAGVTLEDTTTLSFYTNVVEKNGFSLKNPMTATHFKAAAQLKKISDKTYSGLIIPKSYFESAYDAAQKGITIETLDELYNYQIQ